MASIGRQRKEGARYACGKLKPVRDLAMTPHLLAQRAALVGVENMLQPTAGYALGQLLHMKAVDGQPYIAMVQHDAGKAFRADWMRWASLAGLPPHQLAQREVGVVRRDVDPEEWARAKASYLAACQTVRDCHHAPLVWQAIETIVMDDVLPPSWIDRTVPAAAVAALRRGLDALARHYRLMRR